MIHIHINIVITFEIEPKQGIVENINLFRNETFIFNWILKVFGSNSCFCTKYAQLFLMDTQHYLIFVR